MNKFDNDSAKIEYNKVTFHFDWCWIKDKIVGEDDGDVRVLTALVK